VGKDFHLVGNGSRYVNTFITNSEMISKGVFFLALAIILVSVVIWIFKQVIFFHISLIDSLLSIIY
jgi:hypothetical protein